MIYSKEVCINRLEAETLEESAMLEFLFAISLGIIGVVVSRIGKFPILGKHANIDVVTLGEQFMFENVIKLFAFSTNSHFFDWTWYMRNSLCAD